MHGDSHVLTVCHGELDGIRCYKLTRFDGYGLAAAECEAYLCSGYDVTAASGSGCMCNLCCIDGYGTIAELI